jgi:bifunctional non-homologous end joining protein LigD
LDGEIVAMDPATGAPEFGQLQQRLGTVGTPALRAQTPVSYVLFDLTHLDGQSTTELPYTQRRALLAQVALDHPALLVPLHRLDADPRGLLEVAKAHHIEGIVGKRLDSPYRPGRSPAWLKHPLRQRIEVVVGGWTPGQGNRTNTLGALLLGLPRPHTPPPTGKNWCSSARSAPAGPKRPRDTYSASSPSSPATPARSPNRSHGCTPATPSEGR